MVIAAFALMGSSALVLWLVSSMPIRCHVPVGGASLALHPMVIERPGLCLVESIAPVGLWAMAGMAVGVVYLAIHASRS